jgi:glycosyltransferase involved in cell wall biosynthesis
LTLSNTKTISCAAQLDGCPKIGGLFGSLKQLPQLADGAQTDLSVLWFQNQIFFLQPSQRPMSKNLGPQGSPLAPRVSVITIVRNEAFALARTLASVAIQNYVNRQMVVIDGGSTDGTLEILRRPAVDINIWVSEPDEGIYHAMNKGLALADGEWLLFMNAGDEFADAEALSSAVKLIVPGVDVVYSDWIYREDHVVAKADLRRMNVRHQSVLYRKTLHEAFGLYVVGKGVTISDFVFFLSIAQRRWAYCAQPISICDKAGASGKPKHFYQRMSAELMFSRRSRIGVALILLLYPVYHFLKRNLIIKR